MECGPLMFEQELKLYRAVNPINGTSVLRVILQETQITDLGENEVTYDNKTITKSLPGCVAHLLVAY